MPAKQQESFESVYRALEEAVQVLEEGGLPLNDAIAAFETGMTLAARCKALLDSAEARMMTLVEEFEAQAASSDGAERC